LVRYIAWSRETKEKYGSVANYIGQRRLRWFPSPTNTNTTTSGNSTTSSTTTISTSTSTSASLSPSPAPDTHTPTSLSYKNPTPFADPDDYRALRNDWPYGFTPDIVHIVVWLKTPIATDPVTGMITEDSAALIEKFVQRKFVDSLRRDSGKGQGGGGGVIDDDDDDDDDANDRVLWCKNWTALQSVRSLEHIHVFVRNAPDEVIVEWTGDRELVQE
jgi:hypothetical protein